MKFCRFVSLLAGLILCGPIACSGTATHSFTNGDSGRTVLVSPGDEIDVTLSSIGNQGSASVSSPALEIDSSAVIPPYTPAGPTVLYKFSAAAGGQATITIPFNNPANPPPFTLDVIVE